MIDEQTQKIFDESLQDAFQLLGKDFNKDNVPSSAWSLFLILFKDRLSIKKEFDKKEEAVKDEKIKILESLK